PLHSYREIRALHAFPTRRSSDLSWASRARRTAHQLPAMDQARLLQPDGDEHHPRFRAVHLVRKRAQRAVDSLQRVIHTTLPPLKDRKSTRLNSSHVKISYAVFCL